MSQTMWWLDEPSVPADCPDYARTPDEVAAWAAVAQVGAGVLTPFGVLDPAELSDTGRIDALIALERLRAWTDAQQARVFAAMSVGAGESTDDKHWVRDEIGCALRLSPSVVCTRLHEARELVHRLPATLDLLETGRISGRHASALVDAVTLLDQATATKIEARVLPRAGEQTPAAFRRSVRRAAHALNPAAAEQRHHDALGERRVRFREVGDGMGELWALLPLDSLARIMATLNNSGSASQSGDDRTADQRRADTLVELITGIHRSDTECEGADRNRSRRERRRRAGPAIAVTVSADTLLGLDDHPADLDGQGPIPASMARRLAADQSATWRRILTDPDGRLLNIGRRYRPPADLARHVTARDRTCRFPGCTRAARRCDIDHQTPWPAGPTSIDNLECLCARHHHLKHEAGWTVTGDPNGTLTWTSSTGHTYQDPPGTYD